MIHKIGRKLRALLLDKGCPIPVIYGEEATKTASFARERIVIERDRGKSDGFTFPFSQSGTPKRYFTRQVAAKITIYGQDKKPGAMMFEHERHVEHILDMVLANLYVLMKPRKNAWVAKGGRFIVPEDLKASGNFAGAVYELELTFDRAVFDRKWDGTTGGTVTVAEGTIQTNGKAYKSPTDPEDGDVFQEAP